MKTKPDLASFASRDNEAFLSYVLDGYKSGTTSKQQAIDGLTRIMSAWDANSYQEARKWLEQDCKLVRKKGSDALLTTSDAVPVTEWRNIINTRDPVEVLLALWVGAVMLTMLVATVSPERFPTIRSIMDAFGAVMIGA